MVGVGIGVESSHVLDVDFLLYVRDIHNSFHSNKSPKQLRKSIVCFGSFLAQTMEGNKTMVPSSSPSDTKLTNGTVVSNDDLEIETFYVKLTEVLDSSGFNLMSVSSISFLLSVLLLFFFVCICMSVVTCLHCAMFGFTKIGCRKSQAFFFLNWHFLHVWIIGYLDSR